MENLLGLSCLKLLVPCVVTLLSLQTSLGGNCVVRLERKNISWHTVSFVCCYH